MIVVCLAMVFEVMAVAKPMYCWLTSAFSCDCAKIPQSQHQHHIRRKLKAQNPDMSATAKAVPSTDPAVYEEYATKWSALPEDEAGWVQRAKDVAVVLDQDAAIRERENKSPIAEIQLLKYAGLLKILGPKKYGGGEQPWSVGYKAIREVAKADG
jgi:hypothetical protein